MNETTTSVLPEDAATRLERQDWTKAEAALQQSGYAVLPRLFSPEDAAAVAALFDDTALFRKHVVMARHGYGQGDYKYFGYPMPPSLVALRSALYERLLPTANDWAVRLGAVRLEGGRLRDKGPFPENHEAYLAACHEAGQARSTCLILRYGTGDYNRLHQDIYGALAFPLQVAVLLSKPNEDFTGGEFVLTEQRARMQSRAEVVPLSQGDAVVFANALRPIEGKRGSVRVNMRHGVSPLRAGQRVTLGLIFHDAK